MSKRLTLESRVRLETLLNLPVYRGIIPVKQSQILPKIAEVLSVNLSSIWREVRGRGFTYDNYEAHKAHSKALKATSDGNTHYQYSKEQQELILSTFRAHSQGKGW
jgi:IS30 family transposase